ncbi:MAG: TlpA family protein disulfide reductase [Porticoccaceae bacterium]
MPLFKCHFYSLSRVLALFFLALVSAALLGCSGGDNGRERFATDRQEILDFTDLQGRAVVVNYWAIWCAPCRHEIPELNRLAAEYSDELVVVGVNYDKVVGDTLAEQVSDLGIQFATLLRDPASHLGHTASGVLPETLIVTAQGQLGEVLVGPQTLQSLREALARVESVHAE